MLFQGQCPEVVMGTKIIFMRKENKMKTYNRCSLCFEGGTQEFYNKMISYDSLVLCPSCYEKYKKDFNKIPMLCNSIRKYRRILQSKE